MRSTRLSKRLLQYCRTPLHGITHFWTLPMMLFESWMELEDTHGQLLHRSHPRLLPLRTVCAGDKSKRQRVGCDRFVASLKSASTHENSWSITELEVPT